MAETINFDLEFPNNPEFEFSTTLERINLDEEMQKDLERGKGFLIKEPDVALNKTLKRTDSIYSERFTKTLQDPDAFADRYSCKCKKTQGRDYNDSICPYCHTKVQYTGDDLEIFGWINLAPYHIIHPNLYMSIERYIRPENLKAILIPEVELDENGNPITRVDKTIQKKKKEKKRRGRRKTEPDQTYATIGMIGFYEKFDEIMEYFHSKLKGKREDVYEDIMANRDKIFIQNIPVYTSVLRPWKIDEGRFTFEEANNRYTMIAKQAAKAKDDSLAMYRMPKYKNSVLWDIQERYSALVKGILDMMLGKKGRLRSLIAGRCCFTSRSVIIPGPELRIDEVKIPYYAALELLQQTIINILIKTYNMNAADAYMRFSQARLEKDPQIINIIMNIINTIGLYVLINRNPTIRYGSIMAMRVVGINDNFTLSMPLSVLSSFNADFDGDTLNIIYIPLLEFWHKIISVFNPREAMMISRNDGKFNNDMNLFKDSILNGNALLQLSRKYYDDNDMAEINAILEANKAEELKESNDDYLD